MTQSDTERVTDVDDLETVVDADAHVLESVEDITPYIDDRYSGARKIVEEAESPRNDIYSVAHSLPTLAQYTEYTYEYAAEAHHGGEQAAKLSEMEEFGIDRAIVDPTLNLSLTTVENRLLAAALANAYNAWLLDTMLDEHERLAGTILAAPQKPDLAAEEIDDRADEDDMVGVFVPSIGLVPPAGHEWYDPIYEAAQAADLPVVFHGGSGATNHGFPTQRRWNETYAEDHVITHPFAHMWNLTSLLFQGVMERFPDLEFVFQEAGIAWVPYLTWRLDDHYLELTEELPDLRTLPSEYIDERVSFTTQPLGHTAGNPKHMAWAIEMAGADSIMYASDLPHPDFDPPSELFDRVRGHFDAETVRGMMGETALDVFDLD